MAAQTKDRDCGKGISSEAAEGFSDGTPPSLREPRGIHCTESARTREPIIRMRESEPSALLEQGRLTLSSLRWPSPHHSVGRPLPAFTAECFAFMTFIHALWAC